MRQGLYTIPSGSGFLKRLAEGLLTMASEQGDDPFALSRMRVLLPTRRAGRELREAFLSLAPDKPLLLPRLQPIGDVDAEEVELTLSGYGHLDHDIPQAISGLERQFLLSKLVQAKDHDLGLDAALSLAKELARLIDTVHTEDLDFSGLEKIVPDTLSEHWKRTLQFLEIVTSSWPAILAAKGLIDPADRRNRLLKSLARLWQEHPPETPVIAAGSTGSIPSAGELLKTIAGLPQGIVILPGLDQDLEESSWNTITDTHPQATMQNLLRRMEKKRDDVRVWPEAADRTSPRSNLLRAIMRPASSFGQTGQAFTPESLANLHIIEASTPREEAAVIALALREVMETQGKTACFVTPDRTLARRVMTALHRWGIEVDDSAGGALATTRGATYLVSLLRVIEDDFAPLPLLDFLKHDYQRLIKPDDVALLEKIILRGGRPAPGIKGLIRRLNGHDPSHSFVPRLQQILATLEGCFASFPDLDSIQSGQEKTLDEFCQSLLGVAENFANLADDENDFLWSRPESDALSSFISGVMGYSSQIPPVSLHIFGGVLRELLSGENFRSDDEPHRRILILGQLESRLIVRDVMIMGGLNEGTWPRDPGHDPWMSRPMRRNFGLPPADRGTGLSAHDFAEHFSNGTVIMTRSLKAEGTATVPARWLQKLKTLLKAEGLESDWSQQPHYLHWVRMLDAAPSSTPLSASLPAPCPPLSARPQELSATWIEKWMKNPYRVYAEKILRLRFLDPVDKDTLHADRGSFVHDVLLEFVQTYPGEIPSNARDIILKIGSDKLQTMEHVAAHWHYWWPRFERMVDWFLEQEQKWRKEAVPWIQEEKGSVIVYQSPSQDRRFTVTAKADRIDRLKTGGAAVLDYKTGSPPPVYRLKEGTAPQLPIESYILNQGGYRENRIKPEQMIYLKLSGGYSKAGEYKPVSLDMDEVLNATESGLTRLVTQFEDPQTPYMARVLTGDLYDDERAYAHLARMTEWSSGDEGAGDEDIDQDSAAEEAGT